MRKFAQERNVLNKLREFTNISGKAAESFFNPQFKAVMEHIRKKDDQIRTFVVGKKLGDAEVDPSAPALKDILKSTKSNINRREFMLAGHDLVIFHEQSRNIINEIKSINNKVDDVHNEFLYDKLTPEQQDKLKSLKTRFANQQLDLVKEASVMDFLHNISSSRGRGLAAWEKRYPKKVNEIKNALNNLLTKSNNFLSTMVDSLKEMASARSVRNIDDYMKGALKIEHSFNAYEKVFREVYNNVLKKYVEDLEAYEARRADESKPTDSPVKTEVSPVPETIPDLSVREFKVAPEHSQAPVEAPDLDMPAAPVSEPRIPEAAKTTPELAENLQAEELAKKEKEIMSPKKTLDITPVKAHSKFYYSLESLSNESPIMLALYIKKYANSIRQSDPTTSYKLFKIAQQIEV